MLLSTSFVAWYVFPTITLHPLFNTQGMHWHHDFLCPTYAMSSPLSFHLPVVSVSPQVYYTTDMVFTEFWPVPFKGLDAILSNQSYIQPVIDMIIPPSPLLYVQLSYLECLPPPICTDKFIAWLPHQDSPLHPPHLLFGGDAVFGFDESKDVGKVVHDVVAWV